MRPYDVEGQLRGRKQTAGLMNCLGVVDVDDVVSC